MTKNILSKIFVGVFILCLLIFVGFGVISMIKQNKDEEEQRAHYQQMIKEGSKTPLTNEMLEQDHTEYLERVAESNKTFYVVACIFIAAVIDFVLMIVFTTIVRGMEDGVRSSKFIITLVSFLSAMMCIVSFMIIATKFIIPKMNGVKPEQEAYFFEEIELVDAQRVEELVTTGSGDDRTTRTDVYYYIYDKNGKEISTTKILFERYDGPGLYYAGKTASGKIFSLYPDKYFEKAY